MPVTQNVCKHIHYIHLRRFCPIGITPVVSRSVDNAPSGLVSVTTGVLPVTVPPAPLAGFIGVSKSADLSVNLVSKIAFTRSFGVQRVISGSVSLAFRFWAATLSAPSPCPQCRHLNLSPCRFCPLTNPQTGHIGDVYAGLRVHFCLGAGRGIIEGGG